MFFSIFSIPTYAHYRHFLPEVSDIEDASYLDYYSTLASCFPGITELELKRLETLYHRVYM